jgi:hypothetical protein
MWPSPRAELRIEGSASTRFRGAHSWPFDDVLPSLLNAGRRASVSRALRSSQRSAPSARRGSLTRNRSSANGRTTESTVRSRRRPRTASPAVLSGALLAQNVGVPKGSHRQYGPTPSKRVFPIADSLPTAERVVKSGLQFTLTMKAKYARLHRRRIAGRRSTEVFIVTIVPGGA